MCLINGWTFSFLNIAQRVLYNLLIYTLIKSDEEVRIMKIIYDGLSFVFIFCYDAATQKRQFVTS